MDKSHLACLLGGAALASGMIWLKGIRERGGQGSKGKGKEAVESEEYDAIKKEQLARVIKYFGEEKFGEMEDSYVMVLGVGGVGSHVVNMLARSGVKRIKIVDFDRVSLSSLNRHSCAVRKDVGSSKVQCLKKFINDVLPHILIETVETYVTVENASGLLDAKLDYVVDCIDNLEAKVEIVRVCREKGLRLICSGGAGMKCDPTKLQIRDIADCKYDNLVMRLRRELVKHGIKSGVKVAFSYQQAEKELLPLEKHQEQAPDSYRVFENYRLRIIPVLGTMPAILGMTIASYVLCDLAGEPYQPHDTDYIKSSAINKLYNELLTEERRRGTDLKNLAIDMEEVSILAKAVFKWQSVLSLRKESSQRLSRWDVSKPVSIDNLALFGKQEHEQHIKYASLEQANYSEEVVLRFTQKSQQARRLLESGYMMFV